MPVLPNAKHEIVAQELAAGKSAVEASRIAGYPAGSSFEANARKRAQRFGIRMRKAELLEDRAARAEGLQTQINAKDLTNLEHIGGKLVEIGTELPRAAMDSKLIVRIVGDLRSLMLALEQAQSSRSTAS